MAVGPKIAALSRSEGHTAGIAVVKAMVKACLEKGIGVLSVWAFGQENWGRPADEVDFDATLHASFE